MPAPKIDKPMKVYKWSTKKHTRKTMRETEERWARKSGPVTSLKICRTCKDKKLVEDFKPGKTVCNDCRSKLHVVRS